MTQERKNTPEAWKKERIVAAIVDTNASISPEQFQSLRGALGQEVVMRYHFSETYSDEEDGNPPSDFETTERFILKDVNFVRDPRTQELYLAFFRNVEDEATYFPYWMNEGIFGDLTCVEIHCLTRSSGEVLWSFDSPGKRVPRTRGGYDVDIWQDIKDHSESMKTLEKS